MKHLLAILIVALAGAAVTASAANYYDYYENVTVSPTTSTTIYPEPGNVYYTSTVKSNVVDYGSYQIVRTSNVGAEITKDARYSIRITGKSVDIYLTDFIDNVGSPNNSNAIVNMGIAKYGYSYLDSKDASKIGTTEKMDVVADSTPIESKHFEQNAYYKYDVTRNRYYLGTFSEGDEIEIYMQSNSGNEAYSYSNQYKGGYGEGIDIYEHTDELMLYYKNNDAAAARKAMPLAVLNPGVQVYYGIYGQAAAGGGAFGAPLPGGTALYVIAGLFAVGFIVVRRRKEVAA